MRITEKDLNRMLENPGVRISESSKSERRGDNAEIPTCGQAFPCLPGNLWRSFSIPCAIMGKPRMTQRDKWQTRPCVERYRTLADTLRSHVGPITADIVRVDWVAYIAMPKSWPEKRRREMLDQVHRQTPDKDNIDKTLLDVLFSQDAKVSGGQSLKLWSEQRDARVDVWLYEER